MQNEPADLILHICDPLDWAAARQAGQYRAASLEQVGFIHASRPQQAPGVLARFYPGVRGLLLLWIDPQRLAAPLRWEAADGDLYPHIYGPLNLDAVVRVSAVDDDPETVKPT